MTVRYAFHLSSRSFSTDNFNHLVSHLISSLLSAITARRRQWVFMIVEMTVNMKVITQLTISSQKQTSLLMNKIKSLKLNLVILKMKQKHMLDQWVSLNQTRTRASLNFAWKQNGQLEFDLTELVMSLLAKLLEKKKRDEKEKNCWRLSKKRSLEKMNLSVISWWLDWI